MKGAATFKQFVTKKLPEILDQKPAGKVSTKGQQPAQAKGSSKLGKSIDLHQKAKK